MLAGPIPATAAERPLRTGEDVMKTDARWTAREGVGLGSFVAAALVAGLGLLAAQNPLGDRLSAETAAGTESQAVSAVPTASPQMAGPRGPSHLGLMEFYPVVVTAYSSTPDQTDSTPFITAAARRPQPGTIALSRDLLRTYTPGAPFDFGDLVLVAGVGVFRVEDTMNRRWRRRADIWFPSRDKARRWGKRRALLARVQGAAPEGTAALVLEERHLDAILSLHAP
jgi:3D (Asp-Asp-Asp) domain-containing protein